MNQAHATKLKCPACDQLLSEVTLGSVAIDVCDHGCGGVWFDGAELKKVEHEQRDAAGPVIKLRHHAPLEPKHEHVRRCPRCQTYKLERRIPRLGSAIEFDHCMHCHGYWLDQGALEKLIDENRFVSPGSPGKRIFVNLEVVRFIHTVKIKKVPARA